MFRFNRQLHLCTALLLTASLSFGQADDMETLVSYMQGSFTSAEQAEADTNYFNIELEMVRIWPKAESGVWLYVEQAAARNKAKPYRQRIYHVQAGDDGSYTSTMYKINGGADWYGAYAEPERLDSLSKDSLSLIPGCAITMKKQEESFVGSTDERTCTNAWGKASYATSEVVVRKDRLISWDRGWNDAGEQVWGAENGGYIFVKRSE